MPWTHFWDMHSGGGTKEAPYEQIFIEAPEADARRIFYARFRHNPDRVSCTCCGEDYSVSESETLEAASSFHRGESSYARGPVKTVEEFAARPDVLIIRADEITDADRAAGEPPVEGFVWA